MIANAAAVTLPAVPSTKVWSAVGVDTTRVGWSWPVEHVAPTFSVKVTKFDVADGLGSVAVILIV